MTKPANRWLLIGAASALAIGLSACNKTPAATDTTNATADATAAPPEGAMNADNTAAANAMAPSNSSTSGQ